MATDDIEGMIDDLLRDGMKRVGAARGVMAMARQLAWILAVLVLLAVAGLCYIGFTENEPTLISAALYGAIGLAPLLVGLFGLATIIDVVSARYELSLWESPLFRDDDA